jgi:hypothetical protein
MKKAVFLLAVLALVFAIGVPSGGVRAQATSQTWTSSITYYTPSSSSGELNVYYYQGTQSYTYGPITMNPHKAGSLFIGSTSVPDNFAGSAVLSANVPVVATYVQFVSDVAQRGNFGRIIYSAFDPSQAATPFYVPTVLNHAFGSTSQVGVQNIGDSTITATLKFYSVGSSTPTISHDQDIEKQASYVFRPDDLGLPSGFSGSLVVTAGGPVVAASEETDDTGRGAYAFEGVATGAKQLFMPSMLCNAFGGQTTYYAIQNTSLTASTKVSASFYDTNGNKIGSGMPATTVTASNKLPVNPCDFGVPAGSNGSALFTSDTTDIIGIAKVKSASGMATAFVGQSAGFTTQAAPYVRWASDPNAEFRSYIAIMNVGSAAATNIVATYYDANGNPFTHNVATSGNPLGQYIKRGTNPTDAGAPNDFGINPVGGAVEITSDQPVVVVVRTQKGVSPPVDNISLFAEDYNGIEVKP